MVDYSFVRFDSPSISLFFTQLCFFLQTFGRRKPKVGVCVCVCVCRRGKTGGSGRVRAESIKFVGQSGRRSKHVIFKWVNRVAGHRSSRVAR